MHYTANITKTNVPLSVMKCYTTISYTHQVMPSRCMTSVSACITKSWTVKTKLEKRQMIVMAPETVTNNLQKYI